MIMSDRKFYRTLVKIEVLSEEPISSEIGIETLCAEITTGDYSGLVLWSPGQEIDGKTAATALIGQGSDPSFFGLDEEGNDVEL